MKMRCCCESITTILQMLRFVDRIASSAAAAAAVSYANIRRLAVTLYRPRTTHARCITLAKPMSVLIWHRNRDSASYSYRSRAEDFARRENLCTIPRVLIAVR
jgi:hypothetical protein